MEKNESQGSPVIEPKFTTGQVVAKKSTVATSTLYEIESIFQHKKTTKARIRNLGPKRTGSVSAVNVSQLQPATPAEIEAGYRSGSPEFDHYWYGQTEAEAIAEYEAWRQEEIPGGAMIIGTEQSRQAFREAVNQIIEKKMAGRC